MYLRQLPSFTDCMSCPNSQASQKVRTRSSSPTMSAVHQFRSDRYSPESPVFGAAHRSFHGSIRSSPRPNSARPMRHRSTNHCQREIPQRSQRHRLPMPPATLANRPNHAATERESLQQSPAAQRAQNSGNAGRTSLRSCPKQIAPTTNVAPMSISSPRPRTKRVVSTHPASAMAHRHSRNAASEEVRDAQSPPGATVSLPASLAKVGDRGVSRSQTRVREGQRQLREDEQHRCRSK